MRKTSLFFMIFVSLCSFSQINFQWSESFSDGDVLRNPVWSGMNGNFVVNAEKQLQSNANLSSKSYLSTVSEVFEDAVWEFWVRINYNPTSQNYASVYIISDRADVTGDVNGYYVQIGNTNKEIALYRQQGGVRTKIIDGEDKIFDTNPVIVKVKVSRDKNGMFTLFRQRLSVQTGFVDNKWVREGESITDNKVLGSKYFGLLFVNSSATGKSYFFDDIAVSGAKFQDLIPPICTKIIIQKPDRLILDFSEPIDISNSVFSVNQGMGSPIAIHLSPLETQLSLDFKQPFGSGIIYLLEVSNVKDLAGNTIEKFEKEIGLVEMPLAGDLIINEILFDVSAETSEFFEIYNRSDKIIDMSRVFFGTRGTSAFKPSNFLPDETWLMPHSHLAVAQDKGLVKSFFQPEDSSTIISPTKWVALNNTGARLLIGSINGADTLYLDEVQYDAKWHHTLVKNPKNVSLERIHPDMPSQDMQTWHSAASGTRYATPGYKNSQFRDINSHAEGENFVWLESEQFSPDNDGMEDVCIIHYKIPESGYTANAVIFNSVGVKVKQIATNALLEAEGRILWDGKTDRGLNVNPGIYVLYFEMINAEKGVKKTEKMPVVVSAR